ncbi:hypothetical protein JNUCC1_00738 [Lentibacillus sp. JNUCC-1]|uniref:hypothetical protein n=1 Tax=Lentibacillus sp. JNUCC-1 TaxID=2654513 RepID=UPI0012E6F360|nr:hypothetical protein [Lentibacillus sp. JNUCC-1]MUV36934.1 hypothetical protein [Lentibacillus sp. JNUCC-1]
MKHRLINVMRWIGRRVVLTPERDHAVAKWLILVCWLGTTAAAVTVAIGSPTGAGMLAHASDIAKAVGLNGLAFLIVSLVLGIVLSLMYVPLPRLALGSLLYMMALSVAILYYVKSGLLFSYIAGIGYGLAVGLIGLAVIFLIRKKVGRVILLGAAGLVVVAILAGKLDEQELSLQVTGDAPATIDVSNPGESGPHDFTFFTYGSGDDVQRAEYGAEVDEVTPTVDASDFITKWPEKREAFWEFGPENLPLNGRTWLPDGDGPFPVVLMVHGNHTMEYFSTDGYDYLGEQLASRGFLAISVDEDFVNYSNVSGSPNDNYQLRAWLLLKHLAQLQRMNQSETSALFGKADFDQVALIGHSRGDRRWQWPGITRLSLAMMKP